MILTKYFQDIKKTGKAFSPVFFISLHKYISQAILHSRSLVDEVTPYSLETFSHKSDKSQPHQALPQLQTYNYFLHEKRH
jgi:hypothetical protein